MKDGQLKKFALSLAYILGASFSIMLLSGVHSFDFILVVASGGLPVVLRTPSFSFNVTLMVLMIVGVSAMTSRISSKVLYHFCVWAWCAIGFAVLLRFLMNSYG